jgi:hypothetical protein
MQKSAWSPAKDPNQNKVREAKANWNTKISAYISDFIEFKKFFNGRASKFSESRLPLSINQDQITSFSAVAEKLRQDFSALMNEAKAIITLQNQYVEGRTKKVVSAEADKAYDQIIASKASWNKQSKEYIRSLIGFIKLMNGLPNAFINEKTKIHEMFKGDPEKLISIIDNYNKSLISYSVKVLANQMNIKKSDDIDKLIEKYGSNPLGRFWTGIKNLSQTLFSGNDEARLKEFHTSFVMNLGQLKVILRDIEADILVSARDENTNTKIDKLSDEHSKMVRLIEIYQRFVGELSKTNEDFAKVFIENKVEQQEEESGSKSESEDKSKLKTEPELKQKPTIPTTPTSPPTPSVSQSIKTEPKPKVEQKEELKKPSGTPPEKKNYKKLAEEMINDCEFLQDALEHLKNFQKKHDAELEKLELIISDCELFLETNDVKDFKYAEVQYNELAIYIAKQIKADIPLNIGFHIFEHLYPKLEEFENIKKEANLLNNPISDYISKQLNRLKFWQPDAGIRNFLSEEVKEKRGVIDRLINSLQEEEFVDYILLEDVKNVIGSKDPGLRSLELDERWMRTVNTRFDLNSPQKNNKAENYNMAMFIRNLKSAIKLLREHSANRHRKTK